MTAAGPAAGLAGGPGALPLLAPWLQPQRPHTAIPRGPQAVGMAPVHTQRGPTAFWAPGSRPALTPATAPKRWAQREQCPGKARAGSAREDGDNQGLRSPPAHPDASGPAQPGQGLSWTPNQQEGENWGGTGVSAARTLPGGHIFLALGHDPKAGTRCPAERAASCLCPAPLCNPEGGTSPWMPGASRGPSGGGSEEPRMKYRRIQRSQGRGEEGGSHRWPRASCWPSWHLRVEALG